MRTTLMFCLLFVQPFLYFSQHETDKWYFGVLAGIDFSSGNAVAITGGQINTPEGSAVMSDAANGQLLFYTDGISVWDKTHSVMSNGSNLMGASSSTQAALIVPQPGSDSLHRIFTTDEIGGANGLRYSIVDMSLAGGNGDVTIKNVSLLTVVTEKLSAVQDPASGDFWVLAHKWGNDAFYAYRLTSTGLSLPVISNVGIVHSNSAIQNTYGQMKFNGCGTKLAAAVGYQDTIQLFDFNTVTGVVSNPVTMPMADHVYGIEFSPDGKKFYAGCYGPNQTLFQFDISSGVEAAILASKIPLSITSDIYALQLANDGKIYVVKSFNQFLGVINSPNVQGAGCNYVDQGFDRDPGFNGITASLGLPTFVQSFFNNETGCITTSIQNAAPGSEIILFPNPSDNEFFLHCENPIARIEIFGCAGKLMEKHEHEGAVKDFSFGKNYPAGYYIVKFISNGEVVIRRILKTE